MTAYFCDVAFAAIAAYGLLKDEAELGWFCAVFVPAAASLLVCQVLSLRWYVAEEDEEDTTEGASPDAEDGAKKGGRGRGRLSRVVAAAAHLCLCGVLWRYARLLCLPVDAGRVKREMRHLSVLR